MSAISRALTELRNGGMVILVDDEDRENEGDLVAAAEFVTPEAINFMARYGRGLICLALDGEQVDQLGLAPMVAHNEARRSTAFTVSIEAREGITTGISAYDRAQTIRVAADPKATKTDIASPGHVFPLRAAEGGVLSRNGHTEGAVDLMRLAGLRPAGVICEIMRDDGEMARRVDLDIFAQEHGLQILTIRDLVAHRLARETLVDEVARSELPTEHSPIPLEVRAFRSRADGTEHLALIRNPLSGTPLVRVHSECLTGDALGSLRCDCGPQLREALRQIATGDGGALIYLRGQEGRGIGLANKIRAYALQDQGQDTVDANTALGLPADARTYAVAGHILRTLGVNRLRLLSNNPDKVLSLEKVGIEVAQRMPLEIPANPYNWRYLATKREKLGHIFTDPEQEKQNV
ncbi:3,4-dihydroxy-2-butanone-4-phosphate synthase [Devosia sp. 919]|uniref:3,4-dihydroxy-2-butanone-4-phosphate synthase n=1 Tax=Devosia sp. 919 TaxID=2726065 RepID=UPI001555F4E1|nr:3,4-dihydroxy-2-butanone-4-phosphate synthase [Devosia sp. 919]